MPPATIGAGSKNPIMDWFKALPIITRCWFGGALLSTVAVGLGVVNPMKLVFIPSLITKGEIWRLFTPFLFLGGFGFPTCINLYLLQQYSNRYEASPVNTGAGGGTADYAFMLLFGMSCFLVAGYLMNIMMLASGLLFMVLYIWSKTNAEQDVSIYGFPVKAAMLPFVLIGIRVLMGNSVMDDLLGLIIGHVYYFLTYVYPRQQNGKDLLKTPEFLIRYFGRGIYVPPVPTNARNDNRGANVGGGGGGGGGWRQPGNVRPPNVNPGGGHNWGAGGRALGRN